MVWPYNRGMNWLRRNWPDLIIGVALIAVVALIIVTLLSGGSLASFVRRDTPPEVSITETTPGPDVTDAANSGAATGSSDSSAADNITGTDAPGNAGTDGADATNGSADTTDGGVDVFVPGIPRGTSEAASSASGGQTQASTPGNGDAGTQADSGEVQTNAAASGPLPEAAQNGGFRVAAGAVDSRDAAASLAENYRDADYAVTVEQQGSLYLLWVGPYATRAGADQVAARLQTDGLVPDALVYTYSGPNNAGSDNSSLDSGGVNNTSANNSSANNGSTNDDSANNGSADNSSTDNNGLEDNSSGNGAPGTAETANAGDAAGATDMNTAASVGASASANVGAASDTAAATTASASAAGATGQQYLQVGAFASDKSTQPLREQLETLGFNVTRRESDTGLIRLLVGPFAAAQLAPAQTRLARAGVADAFPVAP